MAFPSLDSVSSKSLPSVHVLPPYYYFSWNWVSSGLDCGNSVMSVLSVSSLDHFQYVLYKPKELSF